MTEGGSRVLKNKGARMREHKQIIFSYPTNLSVSEFLKNHLCKQETQTI